MRLFLSSYRLGEHPEAFAELAGANRRVAVIMNAADAFDPSARPLYFARERGDLVGVGLEAAELDLRDYFTRQPEQDDGYVSGRARVWRKRGSL